MRKLIPAALLIAFLVGCSSGLVRPRVEKGIQDALPEHIGPAREYKVRAEGSTTAMLDGLIEHLHIDGIDVRPNPDLLVGRLSVDMDGVRFDPRTRKLKSVQNTTFTATISEAAVNEYVRKTQSGYPDMRIALEHNNVGVEFVPSVAGINVLVKVNGKPAISGADKVDFVVDKGSVAHLPVPSFMVTRAVDSINPILDMSILGFPVTLGDITVRKGEAIIKGKAQILPAQ